MYVYIYICIYVYVYIGRACGSHTVGNNTRVSLSLSDTGLSPTRQCLVLRSPLRASDSVTLTSNTEHNTKHSITRNTILSLLR